MQNLFGRVFGGEALPETVSGGSVTDSNMMTFLGMIEEKTNNLLQVHTVTTFFFVSTCVASLLPLQGWYME